MFKIKMLLLFHLFLLCCTLQVRAEVLHSIPAVVVPNEHLGEISRSVLKAESWTRANVLAHYPRTNFSTIVVGHKLHCEEERFSLVLPSLKNIHYSLTRWGLHREIKASVSFSSACLKNPGLAEIHMKPILSFLQDTSSPYIATDENMVSLKTHSQTVKRLGFSSFKNIHVVRFVNSEAPNPRNNRKLLSFLDILEEKVLSPFPTKPTPFSPTGAPTYSFSSPPSPSFGPISSPPATSYNPIITPASSPSGYSLPPCNPSYGGGAAAPPLTVQHRGLWCVAKPSVPPENLQEAIDYACGKGGADCSSIKPRGSCYYPDSLVAHASVAFNSYWQRNKAAGGTCGFGGTAMLIDSDPSYGTCRFSLGM